MRGLFQHRRLWPLLAVVVSCCLAASPTVAAGNDHRFVGAEVCKRCHEQEYAVWARGPHAQALGSLKGEQTTDAKCNVCHTMAPSSSDTKLGGVQCEACHGAGKYYAPSYVMRDAELARAVGLVEPSEKQCRRCHNDDAPSIRQFDFATMWAEIKHGGDSSQASKPKGGG